MATITQSVFLSCIGGKYEQLIAQNAAIDLLKKVSIFRTFNVEKLINLQEVLTLE
jgi:hypothetical protein